MSNKEAVFRLLARVRRQKDVKVSFKRFSDRYGECQVHIFIDPQRAGKVDTLIHECLHGMFFFRSENWVRRETKKIMATLTEKEKAKLERFLDNL